ncbi:MAG TPA: N-acetylglucosamine-6-phosphate deacetylase [Chitinophagaceae bacterium]|nr:N-acetylglucosamine-6-phosphate deacetylase [Chitinophagaceae bacterium]
MQNIFTADKIFSGTDWLPDHSIIVENELIVDVLPMVSLPSDSAGIKHYKIIAPAFIDVQIYGAAGKLFATYPTPESLIKLYEHCVAGGTHFFLPTAATNTIEVFYKCIDAIKVYWEQNGKGVLGLHIEGPWINTIKRGAHIESLIHPPTLQEVKELLIYGKGVIKMITLAPEICSKEIVDLILANDIIISAGHSNATFEEATKAFDNGIEAATHLFNAMSTLHHREPGLPGAIMQHLSVMASIIPDGYHIDFEMISIAKQILKERLFIITDAVTETKEGLYPHQLEGDKYESKGILSGSALTMTKGVKNLVDKTDIQLSEALRMASLYPARLLGLSNSLGMIKKGYKAQMVFLDDDLSIIEDVPQNSFV